MTIEIVPFKDIQIWLAVESMVGVVSLDCTVVSTVFFVLDVKSPEWPQQMVMYNHIKAQEHINRMPLVYFGLYRPSHSWNISLTVEMLDTTRMMPSLLICGNTNRLCLESHRSK
jgi:hypothetical protein